MQMQTQLAIPNHQGPLCHGTAPGCTVFLQKRLDARIMIVHHATAVECMGKKHLLQRLSHAGALCAAQKGGFVRSGAWPHTWNDRSSDADGAAVLHKLEEFVHVVEELRDDHLPASIHLRRTLRVSVR
jgi:hypothetical protein